ncbi:NAD-dependent epimerase/dehydratase family protein [soil metagenome]
MESRPRYPQNFMSRFILQEHANQTPAGSPPPTVLVTGATGALGPAVIAALQQAGYAVRILVRRPPPAQRAVEWRQGDITDCNAVTTALAGCAAVVHMAALLHIVNPAPTLRADYEKVNVGGTANLVQAALQVGVERLVFFSTIAVYGASQGQILDETTPPHPNTLYGQTKLAAEQIVGQAQRADGQPLGTILRLSAVYGAQVKGNYQRLLHSLARGRFLPIGPGRNRRALIYDRDVAAATVLALQHPGAAGRIYNVTDGQHHTLQEIIQAITISLGRRPPRFALPVAPVRWLAGLVEDSAQLLGCQSPLGRATLDKYTEDIAINGQRIQQELGFIPRFPLASGWQDAIQTMRLRGD